MAKCHRTLTRSTKKHQKNPDAIVVVSKTVRRKASPIKAKRGVPVHRKLDLRKRAIAVQDWQGKMEAARVECVRLGIGAVRYLSEE